MEDNGKMPYEFVNALSKLEMEMSILMRKFEADFGVVVIDVGIKLKNNSMFKGIKVEVGTN